jgi:hypothetical protein
VLEPQAFPQFFRRKKSAGVNNGVNKSAIMLKMPAPAIR